MKTMTDSMAMANGLVVVSDERRKPKPPLPSVITPEWMEDRLRQFATNLQVDLVQTLLQVVHHCGMSPRGLNLKEQTESSLPAQSDGPVEGLSRSETPWMSSEELAEYLKLSPETIRESARKGQLPGHKHPRNSRRGTWRFNRSEVDEFLSRGTRRAKRRQTSWD